MPGSLAERVGTEPDLPYHTFPEQSGCVDDSDLPPGHQGEAYTELGVCGSRILFNCIRKELI